MVDRGCRGHGIAGRAVRLLVDWVPQQPAIGAVEVFVDDENVASQRLLPKIGFVLDRRERHQVNELDEEFRVYRKEP